MKTEFTIGEKPNIGKLIFKVVIFSIISFLLYQIFITMFENSNFFVQNASGLFGIKVALLIVDVIILISIVTSVSLRQYIVITENELLYYSNDGPISQITNTFAIIFNKHREPVIKIPLSKIKDITLFYNTITSFLYYKGHSIVYNITLEDDSYITINPDSFHFSNLNIVAGVNFLLNLGVKINDPHNLIEGLKNENMKFAEYVEKVVIKNENNIWYRTKKIICIY